MVDDRVKEIGIELPEPVKQRACDLPLKPADVQLDGRFVVLKPLVIARDLEPLFRVSSGQPIALGERSVADYDPDSSIWRYMSSGPFADAKQLEQFLEPQVNAANGLCLCVFDKGTGDAIGVCNYMNNFPAHLKVELGNIWYSPIAQGTKANLESTYMLLNHAFNLGYRRLEWKCDSLNERSRRSALRMGFRFEGIQEYHFVVKGRNRDTAWYRILDNEWPDVKRRLEEML